MVAQVIWRDKGWNKIVKLLNKYAKGRTAAIGIQGPEASADHGGITNVEIGAVQEFGSKDGKIPERSHFRSTANEQQAHVEKRLITLATTKMFEGRNPESELRMLGEEFRGAIINKIKGGISPPLKNPPASRGPGPPLWDTGQYINAISVEVVDLKDKQ